MFLRSTVSSFEVYAHFGTWQLPNRFVVNCASTVAKPSGFDGERQLLERLTLPRDYTPASFSFDVKSLLYRAMNDNRVARELIPYLQGKSKSGEIGFFPSILAVLVPKGYLAETNTDYPVATQINAKRTDYGDCWSTSRYNVGNKNLPLGILEIVRDRTDIIVLDGQHRANAFRYLSGDFDPSEDIYQAFYDATLPPKPLNADLPVTLIWFESTTIPVNPAQISRRLFVDVNNNAKAVNLSRNILLNDRAATCLATQVFYNHCAKNGFKPGELSLLHSAFDIDSNLGDRQPLSQFTLTTPEIIHEAVYWAMFAHTTYDNPGVYNAPAPRRQQNPTRFRKTVPSASDSPVGGTGNEDDPEDIAFGPYFDSPEKAEAFRGAFEQDYLPVLRTLSSELALLIPHYQACEAVADYIASTADTTEAIVWRKVFSGGEGLYYTLKPAVSTRAKKYWNAVETIEKRFVTERTKIAGEAAGTMEAVHRIFATKAFQVGYVGAVQYLANSNTGDYQGEAVALVAAINHFTPTQFRNVFEKLKSEVIGGTDPKKWPAYRNLLLRMYDDGQRSIYEATSQTSADKTPDFIAYKKRLERTASAVYALFEDTPPDDAEIERRARTDLAETKTLLADCGLSQVWGSESEVLPLGIAYLKQALLSHYPV